MRQVEQLWGEMMGDHTRVRTVLNWTAGALGVVAGTYAGYVGVTWLRYGHPAPANPEEADPLLDRFIPVYDVAERHRIEIAAPPDITFAAACEQDLMALPVARTIFRAREILLGSEPDRAAHPRGLLAMTKSIGWGVLAEVPGREIVMGTVTQPWHANVVFRSPPPSEFAAFNEPDYVKIVWTLRADPAGANGSIFRTETRVVATDATARARFRRYWSFLSPGIILIRSASLGPLKREAERRARDVQLSEAPAVGMGRS
jgi:hypothetical protein